MADTTKYLGEIFQYDNLNKEKIQKNRKISDYNVPTQRILWKSKSKKNGNTNELEDVILSTFFFNVEN